MSNYHQITFEEANQYLYDYLQNNALFNTATNVSLGATIPLNIFNQATEPAQHGVACWFCWQQNNDDSASDFFMALELNEFNKNAEPPIRILNNMLNRPANDCLFNYPDNTQPTLDETKTFLQNHDTMPDVVATTGIAKTDVTTLNRNYMNDFPDGAPHTEFKKVNCCFFSSKDIDTNGPDEGFLAFIEQEDIMYVRYYFCLVLNPDTNTINPKLILFGVDEEGKNLTSSDRVILEKSWP